MRENVSKTGRILELNLSLKIKFRIESGEAGEDDHMDNGCPGVEPCVDRGGNRKAQCQGQWVWTGGKWPGLSAEAESENPGYVAV